MKKTNALASNMNTSSSSCEKSGPWGKFERLAAMARRESSPTVDVRAAVLRSLSRRSEEAPAAVDPLVIVCAAVSVAAALVAIALVLPGWDTVGDTLVTCLNPLTLVLQ
jgi:hypothetical protein